MTKFDSIVYKNKNKLYFEIRTKYQAKRKNKAWKLRKTLVAQGRKYKASIERLRKIQEDISRKEEINAAYKQRNKKYTHIAAPTQFSFINNTDEVLHYFEKAGKLFKRKHNVYLDIENIDKLTSDSVALMVGYINDGDFLNECFISGKAPKKPELRKLLTESGFYNHVFSNGNFAISKGNILHKETNRKVVPQIAQKSALHGIRHSFNVDTPFEPLYDILIECMSNTHNHASLDDVNKCKWWLYTYTDPNNFITSYSFLDLGVGIYESMKSKGFFEKFLRDVSVIRNIDYVSDLLEGRIQSRVEEDNEIRGKGIPQIVEHSKNALFRNFFIITNDVKINVKTGIATELKHNFNGTFIYWEIQPENNQQLI